MSGRGLGCRSKDRLGQLVGFAQSGGQLDSAHAPVGFVLLPSGAGEISADDAFNRERFRFFHNHRTTGELLAKRPQLFREIIEIRRNKVIVDLAEAIEPKRGELIEDSAFLRDRIG